MVNIEIRIDVPDNVSIVAGPGPGRDAYKRNKHVIDIDCMNIISFPAHVNRIIGSFFTGFFEELRKNMTPGEILRDDNSETIFPRTRVADNE